MVCSRSGTLPIGNAGDPPLVVCERRRVQSPSTISCEEQEEFNVLGRNLLNCRPACMAVVPAVHFLPLI